MWVHNICYKRPRAFENRNTTTKNMAPQHATITGQNVCVLHEKVIENGRQEIPHLMVKGSFINGGPVFVL